MTSRRTWLSVLCAAALAACTAQTPSTPVPTAATSAVAVPSAVPSPANPSPAPTPPPRTRPPTGDPLADAAVGAIEAKDADALVALMTFEPQPCVAIQQVGTNAECPPGIASGTPVEQFALTHCEGGGLLPAEAPGALARWLEGVESVYGAYRLTSTSRWWWGRAGVVVLVRAELPNGTYSGRSLFLTEPAAGAAWLHSGCTGDVEESGAWLSDFGTLEPLGVIAP